MSHFIYLDYQATTPTLPDVVEAMLPYFSDKYGNPASSHIRGIEAEHAVTGARRAIANGLQVSAGEVFFTSGASEANNLAIKGVARAFGKGHIISVATEHKSVLGALSRLAQEGYRVTLLPVDAFGLLDPRDLEAAICADTVLVSLMYGNNETGAVHPVARVAEITRSRGILLHCDATQAMGHLAIQPAQLGIDLLTFSGHKIYGPKGIGVAYVGRHLMRDKLIMPEIDGGGQERGLRAGTLNVPAIVGLRRAYELVQQGREAEAIRADALRRELLAEVSRRVVCVCNTPLDSALPHCLNLSFPGVSGQALMQALGTLALSSGSACNSGSQQPSHVLSAMGMAPELIASSVRLSVGRPTSREEVLQAANLIVQGVQACSTSGGLSMAGRV